MTVTTLLPDPLVDSVKHAVKTPSTCSSATVSTLQSLLRGPTKLPTTTEMAVSERKSRTKKDVPETTRSKLNRTTKAQASISISTGEDGPRISASEKLVLATEVFNSTLRALSDALKPGTSSRSPASSRDPDAPSKVQSAETGTAAIAECAVLALTCLRTLKPEQRTDDNVFPNMQLEQGACVLAGRLLSLGLHDLANKELRDMKKRIQHWLERDRVDRTLPRRRINGSENEGAATGRAKISDLLSFAHIENATPIYGLLVSFQANALRLMMAAKGSSASQELCSALRLSNPCSPANIIVAAKESGLLTAEKAAIQLQVLSNTISSIACSCVKERDRNHSANRAEPSLLTATTLRIVAFEVRCMSWKLSGHVCDEQKEIWDPLARQLGSLARRGVALPKSDFLTLRRDILRVKSTVAQIQRRAPEDMKIADSTIKISTALGQLAHEAGCLDDALEILHDANTLLSLGHSVHLGVVRCKIASVRLQMLKKSRRSPKATDVESLHDATSALGLPLKGSMTDLDELLVDAAKLKKSAVAWLGSVPPREGLQTGDGTEMQRRVTEYLRGFVRFLRRYIGSSPKDGEEPSKLEAFNQRIRSSKNIVLAAVDSVVAVAKLGATPEHVTWEDSVPMMRDAHHLLLTTDTILDGNSDASERESIGIAFVKLSNVYWSRYLKQRGLNPKSSELMPLLKQSTSLLATCSPSQRAIGFAALKFERLAQLSLEANFIKDGEISFGQSLSEHIASGTLSEIFSERQISSCPRRLLQHPKASAINRVLSALLRIQLRQKKVDQQTVFDDDALALDDRGLILEWQLHLSAEFHGRSQSEDAFRHLLGLLLSKLFDAYPSHDYPIRRARVIMFALRLTLQHPGSLEEVTVRDLLAEGEMLGSDERPLRQDQKLQSLATHVRNSLRLAIGLFTGAIAADDLKLLVSSWTDIVEGCDDWEALERRIDDTEFFSLQLRSIIDLTEVSGFYDIQLSALELILLVAELQPAPDRSDVVSLTCRLALQYSRLGYSKRSGDLLARAEQYIQGNTVSCLSVISQKLARVEHLLETGNIDCASKTLTSAQALYLSDRAASDLNDATAHNKIAWERLVADAAYIHSRLSFAQGCTKRALAFAKLSVRLNSRSWAKLERLSQKKIGSPPQNDSEPSVTSVVEGLANLSICSQPSAATSTAAFYYEGALFWPHVGAHHTALLHLASLSAHHGLFQDAIYYGEQALKISKTLAANSRVVACQAQLGAHWILGGHVSEGEGLLTTAEQLCPDGAGSSIEQVVLKMSLSALRKAQGAHSEAGQLLTEAQTILSEIMRSDDASIAPARSAVSELETGLKNLDLQGSKRQLSRQPSAGRRSRAISSAKRSVPKSAKEVTGTAAKSASLLRLQVSILQSHAACSLALRDFDKATLLLNEARDLASSADSQASLHIGESELLLADAIRRFATHAVYCVLPESTISLPSLLQSANLVATGGKKNQMVVPAKTPASRKAKAAPKPNRSRAQRVSDEFSALLMQAGEKLHDIFPTATSFVSTLEGHAASRLMSRISMLQYATAPGCLPSWSGEPANVNEIGRISAFARERIAIDIDKRVNEGFDPLQWPRAVESAVEPKADLIASFTEEYVDILPADWNVLSLSLSADQNDFVVSRLRSGHAPFLLRLPLKRGNSEDDEEQFLFEDGRHEMLDIIKLANKTAHDAKSQTDKQSKKEWWSVRQALNSRLEDLLQNIENIWFGGFRGIFSPAPRNTTQLSRFASAFETILDKHLPSRQKAGKPTGPKLILHENVLELFTGIRDIAQQEDPEDSLMDLLYFVVDILQFQGERNAYDEIDFDAMVIDTLDALRTYHSALQNEYGEQVPSHTVLVLDKSLHMFPWESLPCLQGFPVSRVPSLECLRTRVTEFRNRPAGKLHDRAYVDRASGTYILNPAGDLTSTQQTFEKALSVLPSWTGISNREPSEEEFKSALETKSLFLYFGHGSGAQYIRGRTIKRLDRCAVTFLMGCSSGSLTEAGEFEPYGTPMNYLQAGSPALVATLWDVTDKDIDRFAKSTFESWGLLSSSGEVSPTTSSNGPSRPHRTVRDTTERQALHGLSGREVALDEAVAQSRGSCVLRYLNGAAPVIYGIPVFLD